ncbi:MAG: helix-turn-helix transcriptional regulator [Alphaproteobacteria bacterium]|nr:helix-turn-helix transcriptional regulator [Alphaproteobacteria bacterium]
MLTHKRVWAVLDAIADRNELSASALARRAGLDPTAFNISKRVSPNGRPRWPSTESVAKALTATGTSVHEFAEIMLAEEGAGRLTARRIPLIGMAQAGNKGYFDDAGFPVSGGWEDIIVPDVSDPHAYALQVVGDSMVPVYRDGDVIIVSPAASVRRGDRVVVKTTEGELLVKVLTRRTLRTIDLTSFNPSHPERSLEIGSVQWMARIVWASQ